jgi:hypothetical protein
MQAETTKRGSLDTDVEPAVPLTVGADAARQSQVNLARLEGIPVDAPVTQSSAGGSHRL